MRDRLRPILRLARATRRVRQHRHGAVRVQGRDAADLPGVLDEDEFRDWPDVGIAIQAYLRELRRRPARLAEWAQRRGTPVWVRLVKGAYWDYETVIAAQNGWPVPVFDAEGGDRRELTSGMTAFLIERHATCCARRSAATTSAASPMRWRWPSDGAAAAQLSSSRCSTAWPTRSRRRWSAMGQRVRVYTPFGAAAAGHGVPRPPAAGEHLQRVLLAGRVSWRTCPRSSC